MILLMFIGAAPGGTAGSTLMNRACSSWSTSSHMHCVGRTLKELELLPRFGLTLVAIKRRGDGAGAVITNIAPAADETIREGDVLSLLGSNEHLSRLEQLLAR